MFLRQLSSWDTLQTFSFFDAKKNLVFEKQIAEMLLWCYPILCFTIFSAQKDPCKLQALIHKVGFESQMVIRRFT